MGSCSDACAAVTTTPSIDVVTGQCKYAVTWVEMVLSKYPVRVFIYDWLPGLASLLILVGVCALERKLRWLCVSALFAALLATVAAVVTAISWPAHG